MKINIFPPVALCEKGKRPVNEDFVYPHLATADSNSRTFLVCDGVGGESKGELASQIVADTFGIEFERTSANLKNLHKTLHHAQAKIDEFIHENKQHKGMGTTMSFLQLNDYGAIVAHAGDSRVYHIRDQKILFCTYDHSLVNDLIKMGKWEEAKTAKSNIITRAIQGEEIRSITLDVQLIEDVQQSDYFFLCSDGVWSAMTDQELIGILSGEDSEEEKMATIRDLCTHYSNDNFSAYLVRVHKVAKEEKTTSKKEVSFSNEFNQELNPVKVEDIRKSRKGRDFAFWFFTIIGLVLGGVYYWYQNMGGDLFIESKLFNSVSSMENLLPLDTTITENDTIQFLEK